MTDTDKLKRLAEACVGEDKILGLKLTAEEARQYAKTILALIAENEVLRDYRKSLLRGNLRLQRERDEAVALLRECYESPMEPWHKVGEFLASIDATNNTVA